MIRLKVNIAGVGMIKVSEHWDKSIVDLATEAGLRALEDANVKHVDYLIISNMSGVFNNCQSDLAVAIADNLGLLRIPTYRVDAACGSGGAAVNLAYNIVKSTGKRVLVIGVEKLSDSVTTVNTSSMMLAEDWTTGLVSGGTFVSLNALALKYYLTRYRANHDKIMMLPVIEHKNATKNPYAQFRREITLDMVKRSPYIADPLHLLECSAYGDGAAAVVLDVNKGNVEILASEVTTDAFRIANRDNPARFNAVFEAVKRAYSKSKITNKDIDIIEIHDAFSITGVIALEELGFADFGEGWKLISEEKIGLNGDLPTNTFGGLKARGHPVGATGIYQIAEIALQLRSDAGDNQVDGARIGLAENIGGIATTAVIHILRKKEMI